jgi:hypothetical protein
MSQSPQAVQSLCFQPMLAHLFEVQVVLPLLLLATALTASQKHCCCSVATDTSSCCWKDHSSTSARDALHVSSLIQQYILLQLNKPFVGGSAVIHGGMHVQVQFDLRDPHGAICDPRTEANVKAAR